MVDPLWGTYLFPLFKIGRADLQLHVHGRTAGLAVGDKFRGFGGGRINAEIKAPQPEMNSSPQPRMRRNCEESELSFELIRHHSYMGLLSEHQRLRSMTKRGRCRVRVRLKAGEERNNPFRVTGNPSPQPSSPLRRGEGEEFPQQQHPFLIAPAGCGAKFFRQPTGALITLIVKSGPFTCLLLKLPRVEPKEI